MKQCLWMGSLLAALLFLPSCQKEDDSQKIAESNDCGSSECHCGPNCMCSSACSCRQ